ncbi:MAG: TonB-dependent receptor [Woeseia sp.]|jgi:iron complex outermembrane recepter protein|nr:TonB-dependent receptor [Woeseia sp.]MBT6211701.1 TonB-dependent receptor [Woeseia sp.]
MITKLNVISCAFSAFLISGFLLLPAGAQEQGDSVLDEIVVSATRRASSVRDVARSISVVDKERIQNGTQQLGLDEALAAVPGLYIQNRYNFSGDLRVAMRGFGARSSFGIRGIRVYVDGIPETLPDGQSGVDSIDLGSAQRIEVLRGPSSSLYGNASGGVISVISELGDTDPYVEGRLAAGDFGFFQVGVKAAGKLNETDYLFNLSKTELDGYRDHAEFRGTQFNGRLGIPFGESDRLLVALNITDQPVADDPGGINAAQVVLDPASARAQNLQFDGGETVEQQRLGFVYERERESGTLTLRNHYVWRDFANKLPFSGGGAVDLERLFYGFGAQFSLGEQLPDNAGLSFGVDYDRQDDDRKRFDNNDGVLGAMTFDQNEQVDSIGVFVQGELRPNDFLTLSAGLRYDEISYDVSDRFLTNGNDSGALDFDELSPSIGVNYRLGEGVLFASYGSSFETATTTELANPDASGGFNNSLKPQLADNFEVGFKNSVGNIYYEIALFSIDLEDELIPFELAAFPGRTFYSNAGDSSREGIETALSWANDNGLRVDASFTWSDFKYDSFIDDNMNDFSGNQLPGLPRRFGYLGLTYNAQNGFSGTIEVVHSGDLYGNNANSVEVSSYTVTNLRLMREFETEAWILRPYLGINNLLDEDYNNNIRINPFGGRFFEPAPPRNFYAGVVVRFQRDR